ncbi:universal stress protein [Halorubraceae archaeon YAN]|nr:universal stress protein [Halorubraceae archaeon YAN]
MSQRILVPIDGSEQSTSALSYAETLYPDAEFVLLHVLSPSDGAPHPDAIIMHTEETVAAQREDANKLFETVREQIEPDRTVETAIEIGSAARAIVDYADDPEAEIDAIVMGSRGRDGAKRLLLGSVAETVVRRASVPVTVAR